MASHEFEDEDEFLKKLIKAMTEPISSDEPAVGYWGCIFTVKVPEDGLFMIPDELEFPKDV